MSKTLQYSLVDGIKCYSPGELRQYSDYPDSGFDVTDKLEQQSFWVRSRNRMLKRQVAKHRRSEGPTRMLEIGCGTGAFIREIAADPDLRITGSEIYLKGLHYAKQKLPGVDFIQFDIKEGRLPEDFDLIAAFDVIEHIDDDVVALANVHEMLASGGHFIVTVPQHPFLWSRLDELVMHKRRYTRRDLLGKLRRQGFEIRYCTSFLFTLFPLMAAARLRDRAQKRSEVSDGEFERRVGFPQTVNWLFDKIMRIDETLIKCGVSLPVGGTLLVVARKP